MNEGLERIIDGDLSPDREQPRGVARDVREVGWFSVYNWHRLRPHRLRRGERADDRSTVGAAAAMRRIAEIESKLAAVSKVSGVFLAEGISPKTFFEDDRFSERTGFSFRHACRTLGVSKLSFHASKDRPDLPQRRRESDWLDEEIADADNNVCA